jgi:hypothetical protein
MTTQNPFKSNSNNSRFSRENFFIDNDSSSFSRVKEKKERNQKNNGNNLERRDKSINSFLQDNKSHDKYNKKQDKYFKKETINDTKKDFNIENEDFPLLSETHVKETTIIPEKTFTDVVNTINIIEDDNSDKIKPGWIIISKNKETNTQEFHYGETTSYQLKLQERENDISYMMSCIESELNRLWNKNIAIYDSINGEGSYEERFYLPPVYDDFEDYFDENEVDEEDFDIYSDADKYMSDIDYNSDYY